MSGTSETDKAREGVEQAEAGDKAGAAILEEAERDNPPDAEAAEQEAADGPAGRGLSR